MDVVIPPPPTEATGAETEEEAMAPSEDAADVADSSEVADNQEAPSTSGEHVSYYDVVVLRGTFDPSSSSWKGFVLLCFSDIERVRS